MKHIEIFREKLLILMHLCGGQPARGPEILSIRHCNTPNGESRDIFVENGLIVFVTRYHKGYAISGNTKIIYRYLPRAVGELLVQYLWLVLPFQQALETYIWNKASISAQMWPDSYDGKSWSSLRMKKVLARETRAGLGVEIGIQSYREIAIAISRHYLLRQEAFSQDNDDEDGVNEDEAIMDQQAGHSSHIAGMVYARGIMERDGEVASKRQLFQVSSTAWHQFLGFSSPAANNKRKIASTSFDQELEQTQLARWKRLRTANIHSQLQAMMGHDANFRGIQQQAIEAIMTGDSPIVVVMGTGVGKSLIFMLPAWCSVDGTTIVVVPLISLRQDIQQRCQQLQISCAAWDSQQQPDSAQIVLVTPEAALSSSFSTFLNRLRAMQQLDRIVIDECHVVLNDQKNFRPKLQRLRELLRLETQMILMTATLPPSLENKLWSRMHFLAEEVKLFRSNTTRTNIAYQTRYLDPGNASQDENHIVSMIQQFHEHHQPGKTLVYCNSVAKTKQLAQRLECLAYYHDLDNATKSSMLDKIQGPSSLLVATSAFGMGIDILNIRVIIHVDQPRSLLDYAQESGRAGRDGQPSTAIIVVKKDNNIAKNHLMERFLGHECRRVVLGDYLDGDTNRTRCQLHEELCDPCAEIQRNVHNLQLANTLLDNQTEQQSIHSSDDIPKEYVQQKHNRAAANERMREARQDEETETTVFYQFLDNMKGQCPWCVLHPPQQHNHSLFFCHEEGSTTARLLYQDLKEGIRRGQTMANYSGCTTCFVPQDWCNAWVDREEGGWKKKSPPEQCQFSDMILGWLTVGAVSSKGRKELKARMVTDGFNINRQQDWLAYLGQRIEWGGLETSLLFKECWEALKICKTIQQTGDDEEI